MIRIGINPVLISIGPFTLRWYGVFMAVAVAFLVWWAVRQAKKAGLSEDLMYGAAPWAIPLGLIISRLFHIIDQLDYYILSPRAIFGFEGLTVFGGVIGAALGVWIYSKIKKFAFGPVADMIAPGAIIAQAIGRLGCIINGCCYGTETNVPWAFVYTHPNTLAPIGVPTHPTVVYEIFLDLAIFALLYKLRGRLIPPGSLLLVYLVAYSVGRFFLSYLRQNNVFAAGLLEAQIVSLLTIAAVLPFLIIRTRWVKGNPPATSNPIVTS